MYVKFKISFCFKPSFCLQKLKWILSNIIKDTQKYDIIKCREQKIKRKPLKNILIICSVILCFLSFMCPPFPVIRYVTAKIGCTDTAA